MKYIFNFYNCVTCVSEKIMINLILTSTRVIINPRVKSAEDMKSIDFAIKPLILNSTLYMISYCFFFFICLFLYVVSEKEIRQW
jgi:hypothetical protein